MFSSTEDIWSRTRHEIPPSAVARETRHHVSNTHSERERRVLTRAFDGIGGWRMTYRHTQRKNIRYTLYRGAQATLCASTSVSRSRLSGMCPGTTLGKTGSGCIVLAQTSRRLLPERRLWGCGCPFTMRSGMEISRLAKTVRQVIRRVERAQVQVTRSAGWPCSKGIPCRGLSGATRCGTTMTENIMCSRLKVLSRYTVRRPSSVFLLRVR